MVCALSTRRALRAAHEHGKAPPTAVPYRLNCQGNASFSFGEFFHPVLGGGCLHPGAQVSFSSGAVGERALRRWSSSAVAPSNTESKRRLQNEREYGFRTQLVPTEHQRTPVRSIRPIRSGVCGEAQGRVRAPQRWSSWSFDH